jgi:hypothetical protein
MTTPHAGDAVREYFAEGLPPERERAMREHMRECTDCRAAYQREAALEEALGPEQTVSRRRRARLKGRVLLELAARGAPLTAAQRAALEPAPAPVPAAPPLAGLQRAAWTVLEDCASFARALVTGSLVPLHVPALAGAKGAATQGAGAGDVGEHDEPRYLGALAPGSVLRVSVAAPRRGRLLVFHHDAAGTALLLPDTAVEAGASIAVTNTVVGAPGDEPLVIVVLLPPGAALPARLDDASLAAAAGAAPGAARRAYRYLIAAPDAWATGGD